MLRLHERIPTKFAKWAPLSLMLIFPVLGELYHLVNKLPAEVYSLMTPIDEAIPFIKYFSLPYSIWIFFIYACVIYFFIRDRTSYYRAMFIYTISALTCYVIYLVFQTTVPRPEVIGYDPFAQLMRFIYARDFPYNCFPSIHSFSSYMVMRLILVSPARNRMNILLISGMSLLIIASTLFVKQHVIWDIISAIALVEIYYFLFYTMPGLYRRRFARKQLLNGQGMES
jgi:hypothetical protein